MMAEGSLLLALIASRHHLDHQPERSGGSGATLRPSPSPSPAPASTTMSGIPARRRPRRHRARTRPHRLRGHHPHAGRREGAGARQPGRGHRTSGRPAPAHRRPRRSPWGHSTGMDTARSGRAVFAVAQSVAQSSTSPGRGHPKFRPKPFIALVVFGASRKAVQLLQHYLPSTDLGSSP